MLKIRAENGSDAPGIDAVLLASFPTPAEAQLVQALRSSKHLSLSLVALWQERIIGHAAWSPVATDAGEHGLGLAPVAVLAAFRRQGIAAQLIRQGIQTCQRAECRWMVVLGNPSYYQRFGFAPASLHELCDTYSGGDAFQIQALHPTGLPNPGGTIRYRQEFSDCGC
jgi:putative acetyltransferase